MASIREFAKLLRRTPLHPQWLLGKRQAPDGIEAATGIVLDIGAADRWIASKLPSRTRYIALDYPATSVEFYSARPDIFGDASRLPIADASVDNVICLEVIEHLRNPAGALQEIERVLKPGGRAWISIPFMYPIHNEPYDFQRYTEYGLRREAMAAKLEFMEIKRSNHALRCAAILLCLALAGGTDRTRGPAKALLLPLAVATIFAVNTTAWLASFFWPDWSGMVTNYHLLLRKVDPADGDNKPR